MIFRGTTAEAKSQLQRMTAHDKEPALSSAELDDLLNMARRPDADGVAAEGQVWVASRAYAVGDLVLPTVDNGHYYEVTASDGAAGATQPTWPTTTGASVAQDGVTYTEAGAASWVRTYDLDWAAAEALDTKAARTLHQFDFSADGRSFSASQQAAAFREQADHYRGKISASIPVTGRRGRSVSARALA